MARKKKTDEDESVNQNAGNQSDSDDTFGLPDIEYKPLDREAESTVASSETPPAEETPAPSNYETVQKPMEQQPEYAYDPEEESAPVWPKVLGILLVVAIALGAVWYFMSYKPVQEKAKQEELARKEKERLEQERLAEQQRLADEAAQRKADSLANIPKTGAFEVLTERTMRYYVIVASAVDDDLLTDYAKKLSAQGVSSKLIPPFGKYKLYRLAIADGDTFAATQEVANGKKAEYGDALWVLKY